MSSLAKVKSSIFDYKLLEIQKLHIVFTTGTQVNEWIYEGMYEEMGGCREIHVNTTGVQILFSAGDWNSVD